MFKEETTLLVIDLLDALATVGINDSVKLTAFIKSIKAGEFRTVEPHSPELDNTKHTVELQTPSDEIIVTDVSDDSKVGDGQATQRIAQPRTPPEKIIKASVSDVSASILRYVILSFGMSEKHSLTWLQP